LQHATVHGQRSHLLGSGALWRGSEDPCVLLPLMLLLSQAWNQEGASDFDLDAGSNERQQRFLAGLQPWLQRLSVLIIGPGLGDDPCVSAASITHLHASCSSVCWSVVCSTHVTKDKVAP
jgi:hypothetical protein